VLLGVAAEVVEGPLVGVEEGGELFIPAGELIAPPRVAQGEDEEVSDRPATPERDRGLPPMASSPSCATSRSRSTTTARNAICG
jgi:hypothetical protein